MIKSKEYMSVYYNLLIDGDKAFYFKKKDNNKLKWVNVGRESQGYSQDITKADHKQIHRRLKPILDRLFNKGIKDDDITNRAVIHTLRHTIDSHLAINETPIFTIQKLLDHRDIKKTLRYAKSAPDSGKNDLQGLYR